MHPSSMTGKSTAGRSWHTCAKFRVPAQRRAAPAGNRSTIAMLAASALRAGRTSRSHRRPAIATKVPKLAARAHVAACSRARWRNGHDRGHVLARVVVAQVFERTTAANSAWSRRNRSDPTQSSDDVDDKTSRPAGSAVALQHAVLEACAQIVCPLTSARRISSPSDVAVCSSVRRGIPSASPPRCPCELAAGPAARSARRGFEDSFGVARLRGQQRCRRPPSATLASCRDDELAGPSRSRARAARSPRRRARSAREPRRSPPSSRATTAVSSRSSLGRQQR